VKEPHWLPVSAARAIHAQLISEYGGAAGERDTNLLEAALARPRHLFTYGKPSLFDLAAAYGFSFARNHPFVDGNKRMALAAIAVFLDLNGRELIAGELETLETMRYLAAGRITQAELASWIRKKSRTGAR
jgi:death on curing protein